MRKFLVLVVLLLIAKNGWCINYPVRNIRDTDGDQLSINSDGSINLTIASDIDMNGYGVTDASTGAFGVLKATSSSGLRIYDDGNNLGIFIKDGGNVGISTTNPASLFSVNGDSEFEGEMDLKSNKIVNVTDPTSDQDAATKKYVDDNAGGSSDISWSYSGDLFNSTSTYTEGLFRAIAHATLVVGRYNIYIGSATTDAWDFVVSTKGIGGVWTEQETKTVPAAISSHTVTSSNYTLSENGMIKIGIEAIDSADPPGDINIKVGN